MQKHSDPRDGWEVVGLWPRELGELFKKSGFDSRVSMDCCSFGDTEGSNVIVWRPQVEDVGEVTTFGVYSTFPELSVKFLPRSSEERPTCQFISLGVEIPNQRQPYCLKGRVSCA